MLRKLFLLLAVGSVPILAFGSGKIHGKVIDASTSEALVGANVTVQGTSFGAVTNVSGEFVVLNLAPGTYSLRASFVGYQAILVTNIRVDDGLTTETDFKLPVEGVTVPTVEIVAERPMVNKSATQAVRIIDNEFFAKIPARGLDAAVALQPGVYQRGVNVYIRGGRPDEAGFTVEGVSVADPLFGGRGLSVTAEAVEQVQVMAGGYNAEFGGANAGIVASQLRTGPPDRWKASLIAETDRYTQVGDHALGGYSYGYGDVTATVGGPAPILGNKLRLFGSVENTYYRQQTPAVHAAPIAFTGANALVSDPLLTPAHPNTGISDTMNLVLPGVSQAGGGDNHWIASGTALLDLSPVQIRLSGSYGYERLHEQTTYASILDAARLPLDITKDALFNARISHFVTPTLFYEANFSYYNNTYVSMDPDLQYNIFGYGDPGLNAALGYPLQYHSSTQQYSNWPTYTFFGGNFLLNAPGTQLAGFDKRSETHVGGRIDLTDQVRQHELKVGGEYTRYTIRRYNPSAVFSYYNIAQTYADSARSALEPILVKSNVGTDAYGFDGFGNVINSDVVSADGSLLDLGPRHPIEADAYIQDKIELSDIILNLGLRWDYINPDSKTVPSPTALSYSGSDFLLASSVQATSTTSQISPRIGFSFPASDRTVFHAQFGKFIQQTRFRDSYQGPGVWWGIVAAGRYFTNTWGWGLKPTRTTQYEMGFSQQVADFAAFDVTAFYKDIMDQITLNYYIPTTSTGKPYYALVNGDFTTSKGIEFKFTLRRVERISVQLNYTFADTRSTGTNSQNAGGLWSAGSVVSLPKYLTPVDFNLAHQGNLIIDYRFAKGDGGPVLEQLGLDLLLSFNSGHSFTRLLIDQFGPVGNADPRFRSPLEPIGASTTPWFFQLDARLDKTFSLGTFDLNVYVYVINLLGTDNPLDAFLRTGDPKDDGWLSTSTGQAAVSQFGPQLTSLYNARYNGENSGNFGPPRQIRFGLKLDY